MARTMPAHLRPGEISKLVCQANSGTTPEQGPGSESSNLVHILDDRGPFCALANSPTGRTPLQKTNCTHSIGLVAIEDGSARVLKTLNWRYQKKEPPQKHQL